MFTILPRTRIDVQTLIVETSKMLQDKPVLSKEECEELMNWSEKARGVDLQSAEVGAKGTGGAREDSGIRVCKTGWINFGPSEPPIVKTLYGRLTDVMGVANSKFFGFNLATLNFVEGIQYTLYEGKGSHYGWHIDCLPSPSNPRKLSVSLLLSNEKDYKGGELEVMGFEQKAIQIPQGQGVIFPSYIAHRVKPLESGKRVSLVAWLIGDDFV